MIITKIWKNKICFKTPTKQHQISNFASTVQVSWRFPPLIFIGNVNPINCSLQPGERSSLYLVYEVVKYHQKKKPSKSCKKRIFFQCPYIYSICTRKNPSFPSYMSSIPFWKWNWYVFSSHGYPTIQWLRPTKPRKIGPEPLLSSSGPPETSGKGTN